MQIHLSEIIDSEGKVIQITPELELDTISFQLGEYPILDKTPVKLTIANTGNKVLELTGNGSVTVGIPCDRCLEQVSVERNQRIHVWPPSVIYLVNLRRCNLCPYVQRTNHPKLDVTKDVLTGK